ncbi:hypothetical protein AB0D34_05380 [Streptomyces sp. NPDC048420]|uniref:hypothetical protein n=1 Tax=Streptomyces sp. NPDC048420 TaxID=3155755 RepID=UPI003442A207
MSQLLGPLELVGDRWVIGDPKRDEGSCVVLTRDGMEHHEREASEPVSAVPWARVVSVGVSGSTRTWHTTRTMGVLNALGGSHMEAGPKACTVGAYVRHPYEGWSVVYTHHERPYDYMQLYLLSDLFRKVSEAKAVRLLGDPDWMATVVAKLAAIPKWTFLPGRRVTALLAALDVG